MTILRFQLLIQRRSENFSYPANYNIDQKAKKDFLHWLFQGLFNRLPRIWEPYIAFIQRHVKFYFLDSHYIVKTLFQIWMQLKNETIKTSVKPSICQATFLRKRYSSGICSNQAIINRLCSSTKGLQPWLFLSIFEFAQFIIPYPQHRGHVSVFQVFRTLTISLF